MENFVEYLAGQNDKILSPESICQYTNITVDMHVYANNAICELCKLPKVFIVCVAVYTITISANNCQ